MRRQLKTILAAFALFSALAPVSPARAAATYEMYFPVVGDNYYSDDFGDPRGDHLHQGNDIMTYGVKGVPVVAVAAGTVGWVSSECCAMALNHDDGWSSWYIHLNNDTPGTDDGQGWGFAPGIESGVHVEAGQLIGFVGDSGNAEATAPHLHFELHDDTGTPINPYDHLNAASPAPTCGGSPANVMGTDGDDVLTGTNKADVIIGLDGDDVIQGLKGGDIICAGAGNDVVYGGKGQDVIKGSQGSDVLVGGNGDDTINGHNGHDTLKGGLGDDALFAGKGNDMVSYASSGSPVTVDLAAGSAVGEGSDTISGVEKLTGSQFADTLSGDDGPNTLIGNNGSDFLDGLGDNDVLKGGRGHDQISGGLGDDFVEAGRGHDVADGGDGADDIFGHSGDDTLDGAEGGDTLTGGGGTDSCLNGEVVTGCEL